MDLVERYGRNAVHMAAGQLGVLLLLVVYGLWSPSLGSRIVFPTFAMALFFVPLGYLTLTRPWDWSWSSHYRGIGDLRFPFSDGLLLVGVTLGLAEAFRGVLGDAKARMVAAGPVDPTRALPDPAAESWDADVFGAMVVTDPIMVVALGLGAAMLLIAWLFLPR